MTRAIVPLVEIPLIDRILTIPGELETLSVKFMMPTLGSGPAYYIRLRSDQLFTPASIEDVNISFSFVPRANSFVDSTRRPVVFAGNTLPTLGLEAIMGSTALSAGTWYQMVYNAQLHTCVITNASTGALIASQGTLSVANKRFLKLEFGSSNGGSGITNMTTTQYADLHICSKAP